MDKPTEGHSSLGPVSASVAGPGSPCIAQAERSLVVSTKLGPGQSATCATVYEKPADATGTLNDIQTVGEQDAREGNPAEEVGWCGALPQESPEPVTCCRQGSLCRCSPYALLIWQSCIHVHQQIASP